MGSCNRLPRFIVAQGQLLMSFVLYIKVYVIDKPWCEYELKHTGDYGVNPGLMTSKTPVNNSCFNIVAYMEQQQTTGHFDNGCRQFQ